MRRNCRDSPAGAGNSTLISELGAENAAFLRRAVRLNGRPRRPEGGTPTLYCVLEFMRPGLAVDADHLNRCANYVFHIRAAIKGLTGMPFKSVSGLIVADRIVSKPHMVEIIGVYSKSDIRLIDWRSMIRNARAGQEEFLRILGNRAPDDERLQSVAGAAAAAPGAEPGA